MECNRDEAVRAKEIAEKKFTQNDIAGARKFALKAQNLFPSLEGISQMIATLDVYLAANLRVNDETDWYGILCVNSSADDETVKKQYRKLALQLHPDKNKSIGAEGAFKLISEAWSVLSDKNRRRMYDQKRSPKGFQPKTSPPKKDHSVPNTSNGFYSFATSAASKSTAQKSKTTMRTSVHHASFQASKAKADTFWTSCNQCKMQYEYQRVYLNHNLLCPNCHEPFLASETTAPTVPNSSGRHFPHQVQQGSNHNFMTKNANGASELQHGVNPDLYNSPNFQWGPFSSKAGAASAAASSTAAVKAATVVQQTYEKVKRERMEAETAARREEALKRKSHCLKRNSSSSGNLKTGLGGNVPSVGGNIHFPNVERPAKKRRGVGDDAGINYHGDEAAHTGMYPGDPVKSGLTRRAFYLRKGFLPVDIRNILINRAKVGIGKKVDEWNSAAAAKSEQKEKAKKKVDEWNSAAGAKSEQKEKAKKKQLPKENDEEKVMDAVHENNSDEDKMHADSRSKTTQNPDKKDFFKDHTSDLDSDDTEPVVMVVPDPDFHNFDNDRTERSFQSDEVWATYDDEDGMPRYYALVQKVISLKPFKIRMSFLTSKSNSEFGPLNWVASGFSKTSGDFRVGRYEVKDTPNIFSHRVRWEKAPRGVIRIIPRKGDIWALYRNWSPAWDENTPDDVMYKYDMVEVLEDYNEEQGISVAPLVKVAGFKTVFQRHLDQKEVKRIPREEMFQFSHQVPSYVLTGEEAHNAPKGCYELDPAATPLELLQVVKETKDDGVMQETEKQPDS